MPRSNGLIQVSNVYIILCKMTTTLISVIMNITSVQFYCPLCSNTLNVYASETLRTQCKYVHIIT